MPARPEIETRLTEVFRDTFDDEEIVLRDDLTANDVEEWDSLTHIMLVLSVEREFGVKLGAAEVGKLANVGQMIDLLCTRATK